MKKAPEAPGASPRAHASPKRTVLAEQGGGTTFGTAWSGSTCLEHGQSPSSQAGCSPSRAVGGSPCSPKSVPAPADPASCRLGGLPPTPQCFLSVDSPCACSSTPVPSSPTSSVASLPKVTFCIVLLALSRGIVPHEPRAGGPRPPASWGRGKKAPGTAAVRLGDVQACGHSSDAVAVLVGRTRRAARGSTRDLSLSQGSWSCPRAVPRGSRCRQPLACFQQSAENGKRLKAGDWKPSAPRLFFKPQPPRSTGSLQPRTQPAGKVPGLGRADTRAAAAHAPAPSLSPGVWAASSTCDTHSKGNTGSSHVSVKQTWHRLQGAAARSAGTPPAHSLDDIRLPLYANVLQGVCLAVPTRQGNPQLPERPLNSLKMCTESRVKPCLGSPASCSPRYR